MMITGPPPKFYGTRDNLPGPAPVVEFLAPAGPFADWVARLVDDGFGGALRGIRRCLPFRRHRGAFLMR
jgi:hypothetical protein